MRHVPITDVPVLGLNIPCSRKPILYHFSQTSARVGFAFLRGKSFTGNLSDTTMSIQYGLLDVIPDPNDSITSVNIETFPSPPTTSSFGTTIKTKCRDCSNCCSNTKQTFLDNHHTYPHTTHPPYTGTSLLEQSRTMKQEIGGLFGKIDRKAALEAHNLAAATGYVNDLYSQALMKMFLTKLELNLNLN